LGSRARAPARSSSPRGRPTSWPGCGARSAPRCIACDARHRPRGVAARWRWPAVGAVCPLQRRAARGWRICEPGDAQAKGLVKRLQGFSRRASSPAACSPSMSTSTSSSTADSTSAPAASGSPRCSRRWAPHPARLPRLPLAARQDTRRRATHTCVARLRLRPREDQHPIAHGRLVRVARRPSEQSDLGSHAARVRAFATQRPRRTLAAAGRATCAYPHSIAPAAER
jgi:hypothetical protein